MKPRQALIVGGSLGGLFTARCLQAIGWQVQVFERSPAALDSRGGGIVLQPDVLESLRFAGLHSTEPLGVRSHERIDLDAAGRVIARQHAPQTQTSWNRLYAALRDGLDPGCLHAGETLVRAENLDGSVRAHFASGRVERWAEGELLIGADGARSSLRAQLLPGIAPRYAGYVAWRGLLDEAALSHVQAGPLFENFVFQGGAQQLMLSYLVPGTDGSTQPGRRRWNWVWYRPVAAADLPALLTDAQGQVHAHGLPPGALPLAARAALHAAAAERLAPPLRDLVQASPEPFVQLIQDLEVPQMVVGRCLLLGDAAFVPRPHTAGSTAKAAADARVLAECLRDEADPLLALQRWQLQRLPAGRQMAAWGQRLGQRLMA